MRQTFGKSAVLIMPVAGSIIMIIIYKFKY
jgi:hypothetical protein